MAYNPDRQEVRTGIREVDDQAAKLQREDVVRKARAAAKGKLPAGTVVLRSSKPGV